MRFERKHFRNELIRLNQGENAYLGTEAFLVNCKIESRVGSRSLSISGARFLGGEFHAKRKLSNVKFLGGKFENVKFFGSYKGCDFGYWDCWNEYGRMKECDFSDATLDQCRFINVDMEGIKLPKCSTICIIDPIGNSSTISSMDWPDELRIIKKVVLSETPECSAIIYNVDALLKEYGGDMEVFKKTICAYDFFVLNF
ncbi:pentapeptide repeat-containing protein [Marinobacterium jannaschii]|uniref:pentapeptide repeat-containing protein n=1 Tax=Marinobacterium jannaschii TaxID=64970 RepID=UPI00068569A4|nr:pentapeptide repeat-containing protein [Marinobacterium jannaschii]